MVFEDRGGLLHLTVLIFIHFTFYYLPLIEAALRHTHPATPSIQKMQEGRVFLQYGRLKEIVKNKKDIYNIEHTFFFSSTDIVTLTQPASSSLLVPLPLLGCPVS